MAVKFINMATITAGKLLSWLTGLLIGIYAISGGIQEVVHDTIYVLTLPSDKSIDKIVQILFRMLLASSMFYHLGLNILKIMDLKKKKKENETKTY